MEQTRRLTVVWDGNCLIVASVLMLTTILMPYWITERTFQVYQHLFLSLREGDTGILLDAAFRLLSLNIIRSTPNYLGIMMAMEGLYLSWGGRRIPLIQIPLCYLLHSMLYQLIDRIHNLHLDIGLCSLFVFLSIELLNRFSLRLRNKLVLILLFLVAIQGLDLMPGMTAVGFGNGEISMDVKMVSSFLGGDYILTCFSLTLFFAFAVSTLLMALLDQEQRQVIRTHQQAKQDAIRLHQAHMKNLEMRCFLEIQHLVHDLKSPLTAIQALAELTELQLEEGKLQEYQQRIVRACGRMNHMISEILHEDCQSLITTEQLLQTTLSYMATHPKSSAICVSNHCPQQGLFVNSIRLSRALVNLLENACKAIPETGGIIQIQVNALKGGTLWQITDNGAGIPPELLERIWSQGYSNSGSTGLGLGFVEQVVQLHQGTIQIESGLGTYTKVTIFLPGKEAP